MEFINSKTLIDFQNCIIKRESILSKYLEIIPIKENLFKDYDGEIKSLGAWGGDFILAAGPLSSPEYFKNKGFRTVLKYNEMLYNV